MLEVNHISIPIELPMKQIAEFCQRWQDNDFTLYYLGDQGYEQVEFSQFLPDLDLNLLASYVTYSEPLDAVLEYRQALHQTRG